MAGKILVVGATGNVGSNLVATLVAKGADVRGLAHSEEGAAAVKEAGAEAMVGELTDPSTLGPAFDGVDVAFILTRGMENQVEMARNAINAAKQAGVKRIVRSSAFVPEPTQNTILGRQHEEIDSLVKDSGTPYTILKPTFFMQNLLGGAEAVASQGSLYSAFADGRAGIIDVRDIAESAAEVCTSDGHEGQTYWLTGAASVSMHDVAAALTRALGKDVSYVAVPPEAAVEAMVGMGMPQFMADTYGELFVNFATNGADRATDDVQKLTGHPARSVDDFARDFAGMFGGSN